jgi:hypothetical protein
VEQTGGQTEPWSYGPEACEHVALALFLRERLGDTRGCSPAQPDPAAFPTGPERLVPGGQWPAGPGGSDGTDIREFNCHLGVTTMFAQLGVLPDFASAVAASAPAG